MTKVFSQFGAERTRKGEQNPNEIAEIWRERERSGWFLFRCSQLSRIIIVCMMHGKIDFAELLLATGLPRCPSYRRKSRFPQKQKKGVLKSCFFLSFLADHLLSTTFFRRRLGRLKMIVNFEEYNDCNRMAAAPVGCYGN